MPVATRRRGVLVGSLLGAVALAACGGGDEGAGAPTSTVTTPAGELMAPLTGLPADDPDLADRPAMVVKIDDGPKALGRQLGLNDADVVYDEAVEGGVTRLAAIYHSTGPVEVGPIRSARTSDLALIANLNHPLFVFSGANGGVLGMVDEAEVDDIYYDRSPDLFLERGSGDLRLVIETDTLYDEASDAVGTPPPLFTYREEGAAPPTGEEVAAIAIDYGGQVATRVGYERTDDGWARLQGGEPHVDATGERVTATNVIVQFTEYQDSGFVDVTGAPSPEAELIGEGDAWVLTGGVRIEGRWSRQRPGAVTLYTDVNGRPIDLDPGRTWVELAPVGSATAETDVPG